MNWYRLQSKHSGFGARQARGATLIELMVGMGIMGIVVTAGASLSTLVSSSAQSLHLRNSEQALAAVVRQRIESGDQCSAAASGLTLPSGGGWTTLAGEEISLNVTTPDGTTLSAGTVLPLQGLRVKSLRLAEGQLASECGNNVLDAGEECDSALNANCTSSCRCNPGYELATPGTCVAPATPAPPVAGNPTTEYIAKLYMEVEKLNTSGGGSLTSLGSLIGPVILQRENSAGTVPSCKSSVNLPEADVCTRVMGCSYDPTAVDKCICPPYMKGCSDPATYPVSVEGGVLICKPLGGTCGTNQVLTGIAVGQVWCMNEPAILPSYELNCVTSGCGAGSTCSPANSVHLMGSVATVTATLDAGYSVTSWSGGTDNDASISSFNTVTMDDSKTVVANCGGILPPPPPPAPPPAPTVTPASPTNFYCGTWDGKAVHVTNLWKSDATYDYYIGNSGGAADEISCIARWDRSAGNWTGSRLCKYGDQRQCSAGNLGPYLAMAFPACPQGSGAPYGGGDGCAAGCTGTDDNGWCLGHAMPGPVCFETIPTGRMAGACIRSGNACHGWTTECSGTKRCPTFRGTGAPCSTLGAPCSPFGTCGCSGTTHSVCSSPEWNVVYP